MTMAAKAVSTEAVTAPGDGARHPLQHRWVLWFDNPKLKSAADTWEENLDHVMAFDTVESFWGLFNNIIPPSMLSTHDNYSVFKEGIKPMWEDSGNIKGGMLCLAVKGEDLGQFDQWWLRAVLAAIGETLESDAVSEVCGLVVSLRKGQHRIAVWTKTCDESRVIAVGKKLKEALKLPARFKLQFQTNEDASSSLSSMKNAVRFEV